MEILRNGPCPCGSGKKYKKCCLGRQDTGSSNGRANDVSTEMRQALGGQAFSSTEEAQAFLDEFMGRHNRQAVDDFQGLSPDQMYRFLHFPFGSSNLVSFSENLDMSPSAPIVTLFELLVAGIGDQGLKATAKGNLPRNFCRGAALSYWGDETYRDRIEYGGINKEEDFIDLHTTRLISELTGLVRKYKGRFILSRKCRRLLPDAGTATIYPLLLRSYARKFNWAYSDGYPALPFVQQSFLFTLYLLKRVGENWLPLVFYEDCFLRAFPKILGEIEPTTFFTPEQQVRSCYSLRTLKRFAVFLGLAIVEPVEGETSSRECRVRKLSLLDKAVQFHKTC